MTATRKNSALHEELRKTPVAASGDQPAPSQALPVPSVAASSPGSCPSAFYIGTPPEVLEARKRAMHTHSIDSGAPKWKK